MDHAEYWLMDIVIDHAEPVRGLLPPPEEKSSNTSNRKGDGEDAWYFAVAFNRASHGLSSAELADTLCGLFAKNYLMAQWSPPYVEQVMPRPFMPTRRQIEDALADPRQSRRKSVPSLFYALTAQGGAAWEAVTQPDWDLFIRHEEAYGDTWEEAYAIFPRVGEESDEEDASTAGGDMPQDDEAQEEQTEAEEATQRLHVRMAGAHRGLLANSLSLDKDWFGVVVDGSEQWATRTPWQALYWKTLPRAYEVCYSISSDPELEERGGYIASHAALIAHPARMATAWYTDYITGRRIP